MAGEKNLETLGTSSIHLSFVAGKKISNYKWWIFQQAMFDDTGGYPEHEHGAAEASSESLE